MEMEFHPREQGVGNERGKVMKPIWGGEEFCKRNMEWFIRGKEDVGNIIDADKFCDSKKAMCLGDEGGNARLAEY